MLTHIMDYLQRRGGAGVEELARVLDASPDAVRGMLQTLARRRLVHPFEPTSGCGVSCGRCQPSVEEYYCAGPGPEQDPIYDEKNIPPGNSRGEMATGPGEG